MVRSKIAGMTGWLIEMDQMDVPTGWLIEVNKIGVPTLVGALFFLLVLAIEFRVSRILGKYFIIELYL